MREPYTMPHWTDPRVKAVAEAIWDDEALGGPMAFPRESAVMFWPGFDARRAVAIHDALRTTEQHSPAQQKKED